MPELPEVETVARQLDPFVRGRTLKRIQLHDSKLKFAPLRVLEGRKVLRVFRVGKLVVFEFTQSKFLAIHLRMSGRLFWSGAASLEDMYIHGQELRRKHIRAEFHFDRGELTFVDPRRFGTLQVLDSASEFYARGIDPFDPDFTPAMLSEMLKGSKQGVKQWLLRQDRVLGIGNIYASEILFDSRINPKRRAGSLSKQRVEALHKSISAILGKAIKHCGTSFSDFQHTNGDQGSFAQFLKVYERGGEDCRICEAKIKRFVQGQRSTYYCSVCQK